jgi:hypothetical protein
MKLFSFWRSLATYRVRIALNLKGLVPDEVDRSCSSHRISRRDASESAAAAARRSGPRACTGPRTLRFTSADRAARAREYLEHEFKLDEPTGIKWCQHWHTAALTALEAHLEDAANGRYCHGDAITLADFYLARQAATIGTFARAHPLKQPGARAS